MKPNVQTVVINTMGMIAASGDPVGSSIYSTEASGDALSRGDSYWDDEDE